MFTEVHAAFGEFLYMFGSFILNVYFELKMFFTMDLPTFRRHFLAGSGCPFFVLFVSL